MSMPTTASYQHITSYINNSMVLMSTMLQKSPPEKELLHKKGKAPPLNLETQLGSHVHAHNSKLSTCNFLN
jgi:hypothetical protein